MYTDKNPITATPVDYHVEAVAADPDSVRGAEPVQAAPQIISRDLSHINAGGAKEFLQQKGWPEGLQNAFVDNLAKVPIRFFICDDSGSMMTNDGHKLVDGKNGKKV